jgi:hypothetical protein
MSETTAGPALTLLLLIRGDGKLLITQEQVRLDLRLSRSREQGPALRVTGLARMPAAANTYAHVGLNYWPTVDR